MNLHPIRGDDLDHPHRPHVTTPNPGNTPTPTHHPTGSPSAACPGTVRLQMCDLSPSSARPARSALRRSTSSRATRMPFASSRSQPGEGARSCWPTRLPTSELPSSESRTRPLRTPSAPGWTRTVSAPSFWSAPMPRARSLPGRATWCSTAWTAQPGCGRRSLRSMPGAAGAREQGVADHRGPAGHRRGGAGADRPGRLRALGACPVPAWRSPRGGAAPGAHRQRRPVPRTDAARARSTSRRREALAHPTWDMGPLVTINSATLVNKGLEVIEAHLLFDLPFDRIEVVVHPQSIVHSMVEFVDGSTIAQASPPDMRLPIALGLAWPDRVADAAPPLDWTHGVDLGVQPAGRRAPSPPSTWLVAPEAQAGRPRRSSTRPTRQRSPPSWPVRRPSWPSSTRSRRSSTSTSRPTSARLEPARGRADRLVAYR